MQIAYRICKQMVFRQNSPTAFRHPETVYCTHREPRELLRWPGVHRTEEVQQQLEHRDPRPEIQNKSFISNIGKGIWKPSFVDHSTCRIWHNMKNRVNISRRKSPVLARDRLPEASIVISFSEKPSKVSKDGFFGLERLY